MKARHPRTAGFSIIEFIILLVVLGALGFVGYTAYNRYVNQPRVPAANPSGNQPASADVSPTPLVNSADDLDRASSVLDQNDPTTANNSDNTALDSQLSGF